MAQAYTKPHLSYDDQLALLEGRGLRCADRARAIRTLRAVGYYRFSAYVYPFREPLRTDEQRTSPYHRRSDRIMAGATFEHVESLWRFDRLLRMGWLDGLETVEVGVRTRIAYVLGKRDTFGHVERAALDPAACARPVGPDGVEAFNAWSDRYSKLRKQAMAEDFVSHNIHKYGGQLPVWTAVEFLDFGAVVSLFGLLVQDDQNTVAREFGIRNGRLLVQLLKQLNYVRNAAAHHSRLWNRVLTLKPAVFPDAVVAVPLRHVAAHTPRDKVYVPLAVTAHLARQIDPDANWPSRMRTVLRKFPEVPGLTPESEMGFPAGWDDLPLWAERFAG